MAGFSFLSEHAKRSANRPDKRIERMSPKEPRCGCGAVIQRDGKILLVKRLSAPEAYHWGLPGGKVDWLEPVEQAVIREVREELGVEIGHLRLLCVVDQIDLKNQEHWIAPVYVTSDMKSEPRIVEPHKHEVLGWFSPDQLPSPLTQATVMAVSALKAIL